MSLWWERFLGVNILDPRSPGRQVAVAGGSAPRVKLVAGFLPSGAALPLKSGTARWGRGALEHSRRMRTW